MITIEEARQLTELIELDDHFLDKTENADRIILTWQEAGLVQKSVKDQLKTMAEDIMKGGVSHHGRSVIEFVKLFLNSREEE